MKLTTRIRALSWLLMAAMLLTLLPVGSHAAGTLWTKVELADIQATDTIAITMTSGGTTWVLPTTAEGTKNQPLANITGTIVGSTLSIEAESSTVGWSIAPAEGGYYIMAGESYLYVTATNNGVRIGKTASVWNLAGGYLSAPDSTAALRYLGVYNGTDWRCYKTYDGSSNIAGQTLSFWRLDAGAVVEPTEPGVTEPAAPGAWVKTELTDIQAADTVAITMTKGGATWILPNTAAGTKGQPLADIYGIVTGSTLSTDANAASISWTVKATEGGYHIMSGEKYLYITVANNGVRIGNTACIWDVASGYLTAADPNGTVRYLGVYIAGLDWRCYTSTTGNIADQSLDFWVLDTETSPDEPQPSEIAPTEAPVLSMVSIGEALAGAEGEVFAVEGAVTLIDGRNIFIQDDTGAICVRMDTAPTDITLGTTILGVGTRGTYNGLPQLGSATYTLSGGVELTPRDRTIGELTDRDICAYIRLTGVEVTAFDDNGGTYTRPNITLSDGTNSIMLFKAVTDKTDGINWDIQVGDIVDVNAALSFYGTDYQLRNTWASEITKVEQEEDAVAPLDDFQMVAQWVTGETVAEIGSETIAAQCQEMGITDIYLLVKNEAGLLEYQKTQYTGLLARTDRDILQEMLDAGHSAGLRVHAWIPSLQDAAFAATNPTTAMTHYDGSQNTAYIDPYNSAYLAYMTALMQELAAYEIDGIHLGDLHYGDLLLGWSETDFASLEEMGASADGVKYLISKTFYPDNLPTGEALDGNYIYDQYNAGNADAQLISEYRRNNLVDFAISLTEAARAANPDLILSAGIPAEAALNEARGGLHHGNNYADYPGLFDYVCPKAEGLYGSQAAEAARAVIAQGNLAVIGLDAYDAPQGITSPQLMANVEAVREILKDMNYADNLLGIALYRGSEFGYAKVIYDQSVKSITVRIINPDPTRSYSRIRIEPQKGLTLVAGTFGQGLSPAATVELAADRSYISYTGSELLGPNSSCTLTLAYAGTLDISQPAAMVSVAFEEESRAYHVYRDVADEDMPEKNGIIAEKGGLYYYINGTLGLDAGLIRIGEDYYYITADGKAVTGEYTITKTNDLMPAGDYVFGADGRLQGAVQPEDPGESLWKKVAFAHIQPTDTVAITMSKDGVTWVLPNTGKGNNKQPLADILGTISGTTLTAAADASAVSWNIVATEGGYYIMAGESYLYVIANNNGVRVGSTVAVWNITDNYLTAPDTAATPVVRYLGVYNSQDWRCYSSINSNITEQTLEFWKLTDGESTEPTEPDPNAKNGIYLENGLYYYYINDEIQYSAGLVFVDGSYYYIRSGGYAAIGEYWCTNTNGITAEGFYIFGEDGKMILNDSSKTGIYYEGGKYYYYVNGEIQFGAGLVYVDGYYYYIRSGGYATVGEYYVSNTNGLMPEGLYTFGNDGRMIIQENLKNGIILENGLYYYYIDGEIQYAAGLVFVDGAYYYIRSGGYAAIGSYWVTNTNGITQEGFYIFAEDGKMILTDTSKNGIYYEDGLYYYYVDGEIGFGAGLVLVDGYYYYIRSGGYAAVGQYYVSITNGLLPEGMYTFGEDGKMIR